jgi:hypothetical protein
MRKSNLYLHCGARKVEREQLALVPTPERTATWVPIPHARLLATVRDTLERGHFTVVGEAHGLARDGGRYFGLLEVASGHGADDFGLVVGLRNSHDKTFPAGLVVGASIFVCDNLSFSGEIKLSRKHTVNVERDLPQLVNRAVAKLADLRYRQEVRFQTYKTYEVSDRLAHDLLVRAVDARVLPVTKLPCVLREWREPRHPEFRQGKTGWRLFNAFTEVLKGQLDNLPRRTQALHGLLDAACGLVLPAQEAKAVAAGETPLAQAV